MRTLYLLAVIVSLVGCDSSFEIDLPEEEPRLVIKALFSADSLLAFSVDKSTPVLEGPSIESVKTATVEVFEDDVFVGEATYGENRVNDYQSEIRPRPGRTYRIRVSAPGFAIVEAEDTVPLPTDSFEITSVERGQTFYGGDRVDIVTVGFDDPPGEDAYALYSLAERVVDGRERPFQYFVNGFESDSPYLTDGFLSDLLAEGNQLRYVQAIFSSEPFDGESISIQLSLRRRDDFSAGDRVVDLLRFARLSPTYYRYARALEADRRGTFLGDVTRLPSNVEGGYGIFAAFTPVEHVVPKPTD